MNDVRLCSFLQQLRIHMRTLFHKCVYFKRLFVAKFTLLT